MSRGFYYGLAAYGIWGLFPAYWRLFPELPATQVLAHRIVWSFAVLAVVLAARRRLALQAAARARVLGTYAIAAVLIAANWLLYVWAVNHELVVETSLGYFITPLVNVVLGVLVFGERLRPPQWAAVALAGAGVADLAIRYGSLPWIAIGLALSFGTYGLVKKKAPLPPLEGLALETALLMPPAAVFLLAVHAAGGGAFTTPGRADDVLLVGGGVITVGPLLLFAAAVQLVPLSVIGVLQYVAPTIQFLLGVVVFEEPFTMERLIGFGIVWTALAVFAADGLLARRRRAGRRADAPPAAGSACAIRRAGPADAALVERMLQEAAAWVDALGERMWTEDELDSDRVRREIEAGQFFVAEIDGEPAGLVRFQLDDPLFWPDVPRGEAAFVHRLVVRRAFKSQGVSTALLAWAATRAREMGLRYLRLDCDESRPKLRALYERFGFRLHSFRQVGAYYVARYELPLA